MNAMNDRIKQLHRTVQLVRAAQNGDRTAFGQLFEQYESVVYAIAMRRLNDHSDAQELCQDVFIQAMEKIGQLRAPECFVGWLRSITVRMAINRIMRQKVARSAEPQWLAQSVIDPDTPMEAALSGERHDQLRQGLQRLREMDRETLEAFYVQGQSLIEMSDQFEAPIGTIKRRLHVARKRLAKEVEELAPA